MLLCTVMDVALEASPLRVLGRDDALSRGAQLDRLGGDLAKAGLQLRGQPHVAEHLPGLGGQVSDERLFDRGERLPRTLP